MQINFPDIRQTFIPDPGYIIFDVDLEGADAQVVAWDANEPTMKAAFKARKKIHAINALDMYGPELAGPDGKREPLYTRVKRAAHATHYGGTPPAIARKCKMPISDAQDWQERYFRARPAILEWMKGIEFELQTTGGLTNIFGYGINFYQRGADAYTEALAWKPQSVVARVCEIAMVKLTAEVPNVTLFLQVHDSLVGQIRADILHETLAAMHQTLHSIIVPYPDPLIIPWGLKLSRTSWGECKTAKWSDYLDAPDKNNTEA